MNLFELQVRIHDIAKAHGWWEEPCEDGTLISLMHAELSEALEWLRKDPEAKSDHIPEFLGVEEELADCIIRILDFAGAKRLKVIGAMLAKIQFNDTRSYRHGEKRF